MQFRAQHLSYMTQFPAADFLIILWHERPIGRLYIERRADEIRGIDIALLPAYRQAGIGTAILQGLLAEAASDGKPFRIHVEKFNRAQRLYERLGFTTLDDDGVYLLHGMAARRAIVDLAPLSKPRAQARCFLTKAQSISMPKPGNSLR